MYAVELYNRVRLACHVEGMSKSAAARLFNIDRKTVAKILMHSVPPGYRRSKPPVRPKLDTFIPIIDQILEDDKRRLKKQRHTAKRIFERLRPSRQICGANRLSGKGRARVQRRDYHRHRLCPGEEAPDAGGVRNARSNSPGRSQS